MAEIVEGDLVLRGRFSRTLDNFKRATNAAFRNSERRASRAIRAFTAFRGSIVGSIGALVSLKGAIAAAGIGFLTKKLIALATTQEDAVNRLNAALKTTGQFSDETSASIQRLASAFQRQTTFGDEAVLGLQALLITYGVTTDQIEEATRVTLDFAVATGRDLNTAALTVGKAAAGFTGELSRYGIIIDKNIPKTKKFRAVLDKMNKQFSGAAQAATRTFSGRMTQLGNAIGDVGEELGFMLTESETLGKVIGELTILAKALAVAMGDIRKETDDTKKSFSELVLTAEFLLDTIQFFRTTIALVELQFQTLTGAVLGLAFGLEKVTDFFGFTEKSFNQAEIAINLLTEDMQKNVDIVLGMDPVYLKASSAIAAMREEQKRLAAETKKANDALGKQKDVLGLNAKVVDLFNFLIVETLEGQRVLADAVPNVNRVLAAQQLEFANLDLAFQKFDQALREKVLGAIFDFSDEGEERFKKFRELVELELDRMVKATAIRTNEVFDQLGALSAGFRTRTVEDTAGFLINLQRRFDREKDILKEGEAANRLQRDAIIGITAAAGRTLLRLAETFGGQSIAIQKAAAVAEAVINTAVAVTRAFRIFGPTPGGFAAAAVIAAIGAAQIATIIAAKPGGGGAVQAGGGAAAATAPATPVAEAAPAPGPREITINISGFVGDEALLIDEIARITREAVGDNLDFGSRVSR